MEKLIEVALDDVMWMIAKVDEDKEIVHPAESKNTTVKDLIEHFSESEDFHVFIYQNEDGDTVGFSSTFPNKEEGRISIGVTYIIAEYRGKGYGFRMRQSVVDWIKRQGYDSVYARTWSGNEAMLQLNKKMGFKEIGRDVGVRENGDDTVKFLLELTKDA